MFRFDQVNWSRSSEIEHSRKVINISRTYGLWGFLLMSSMRSIAKELGISHSYLSYMVNGKRPWSPELHNRYQQLVTTALLAVTTFQPAINTNNPGRLFTRQFYDAIS